MISMFTKGTSNEDGDDDSDHYYDNNSILLRIT